ncbi:sugar phosphate isomerase/epimerase family protein [Moorella sp. ACPs]|uniref:sugar phosphate isomerase/epimerase family protein n=1 Tax=Neomoorella carbonis TaxID=3062783 RepID=UPI0038732C67
MKLGYQTNTWGGVIGHPAGVTSVKDAYYLANGSTEKAITEIAKVGFEGVEIFDGNLMQYETETENLNVILKKNNVKLVGVYSGANFIYKEILPEELNKIKAVARLASIFGAEHLVVGGGGIRTTGPQKEDYKLLAEGLDKVVKIAEEHNLIASYHPHLGTLCQSPEQLDILMQFTKINLCPDTAHLVAGGGDALAIVKKYIDRIKYIHLKDYRDGVFLPLGEGQIDIKSIIKVLKDTRYEGWLIVELDAYDIPKKGAEISYRYLKNLI